MSWIWKGFGGGLNGAGGGGWAAYNPGYTRAQWESNSGASAWHYVDFRDSSSLTLTGAAISAATDKSSNTRNLTVSGFDLVNLSGVNAAQNTGSGTAFNAALGAAMSGTTIANPHQVGIVINLTSNPGANQYLWSTGRSATSTTARNLYIDTAGKLNYEYITDSGTTETYTASAALPTGTPVSIWVTVDRTRVIVWQHDGSSNVIKRVIVGCSGPNLACTTTHFYLGCKYSQGTPSNYFTNGYVYGVLVSSQIVDAYACMAAMSVMFGISTTGAANTSTLHTGIISHVAFPTPGGTTTTGDFCDLINGVIFPAVGTLATTAGLYGRTYSQTADANRAAGTSVITASQDFYNKATFHLRVVFYPTEVSSTRVIFQQGVSPFVRLFHSTGTQKIILSFNNTNAVSTGTVANNTLNYVDVWASNSLTVNMSLNGETAVTVTRASYQSLAGENWYWGSNSTPSSYYRGRIEEFTLWDRVLSAGEMTAATNSGNHRHGYKQYIAAEA